MGGFYFVTGCSTYRKVSVWFQLSCGWCDTGWDSDSSVFCVLYFYVCLSQVWAVGLASVPQGMATQGQGGGWASRFWAQLPDEILRLLLPIHEKASSQRRRGNLPGRQGDLQLRRRFGASLPPWSPGLDWLTEVANLFGLCDREEFGQTLGGPSVLWRPRPPSWWAPFSSIHPPAHISMGACPGARSLALEVGLCSLPQSLLHWSVPFPDTRLPSPLSCNLVVVMDEEGAEEPGIWQGPWGKGRDLRQGSSGAGIGGRPVCGRPGSGDREAAPHTCSARLAA